MKRRPQDRGSVAIVLVAGAMLMMIMALALGDVASFVIARARAQTAADAAALAATAELIPSGGRDPVNQASRFADMNGASLINCDCSGKPSPSGIRSATVEVSVPVRFVIARAFGVDHVAARARAQVDPEGLIRPRRD